ncbi:Zinc metalloproteinase nas-36 [Bienertia sinuspersici]
MKQWSPDIELHKENVKTVPIWIRMPNLDLKYWGQGCLHKLGDIIGPTATRVGPSCTKTADTEQKAEEKGQKDSQGFLSAQRKRIKPADQAAPVTPIHNSFEALSSDSEEDEDEVDNLAAGEQPWKSSKGSKAS